MENSEAANFGTQMLHILEPILAKTQKQKLYHMASTLGIFHFSSDHNEKLSVLLSNTDLWTPVQYIRDRHIIWLVSKNTNHVSRSPRKHFPIIPNLAAESVR